MAGRKPPQRHWYPSGGEGLAGVRVITVPNGAFKPHDNPDVICFATESTNASKSDVAGSLPSQKSTKCTVDESFHNDPLNPDSDG